MSELIKNLASEIIDKAAEVGLVADRLKPNSIAASTVIHLRDAKLSLQHAMDSLGAKIDTKKSPPGSL